MQLIGQGFVLIQDNDQKHTSKLCQIALNWSGINLTEKSELKNPHAWLTFGNSNIKNPGLSTANIFVTNACNDQAVVLY